MWLKSSQLQRDHVKRAEQKHRCIVHLIKKVGKRNTGMGLKIVKYHAIMHMSRDILNFGVPMCYDTGSNESGHKETKKAAKLTQKCESTFDKQMAQRLDELRLLELAMQEIEGRRVWDYGRRGPSDPQSTLILQNDNKSTLTGGKIQVEFDEDLDPFVPTLLHKSTIQAHWRHIWFNSWVSCRKK